MIQQPFPLAGKAGEPRLPFRTTKTTLLKAAAPPTSRASIVAESSNLRKAFVALTSVVVRFRIRDRIGNLT